MGPPGGHVADLAPLYLPGEIPEWAQPAFGGTKSLNRVQSRVYNCAMFSAENMLICAPTGAGKTNVAMLCMLHEIGMHRSPTTGAATPSNPAPSAVEAATQRVRG